MNKANKKFKHLLEQRLVNLNRNINSILNNFIVETNKNSQSDKKIFRKIASDSNVIAIKYEKQRKLLEKEIQEIQDALEMYENLRFYLDFETIQKYLDLFGFDQEYQADVLSYYINCAILFFDKYPLEYYKKKMPQYVEYISKEENIKMNFITKKIFQKRIFEKFEAKHNRRLNDCKNLRGLISLDGSLIPNIDAEEYVCFLKDLDIEISDSQLGLIVDVSKKRATVLALEESVEVSKKRNKEMKTLSSQREVDYKSSKINQRLANEELKKYLINDTPIALINDEELKRVMELLKALGYTDISINEIRRKILANNQKLLAEIKSNQLKEAEEKYLSDAEKELLVTIESLLGSKDAIKNNLYDEIRYYFNAVKALLLKLNGVTEEETIKEDCGYLLLYIEELSTLLEAYKDSNYKLILNINSN